jgi:hypothetical protein
VVHGGRRKRFPNYEHSPGIISIYTDVGLMSGRADLRQEGIVFEQDDRRLVGLESANQSSFVSFQFI